MEDSKHTPPWILENANDGSPIAIFESNGRVPVARFYGPDREANAQLFMDAPGMKAEIEKWKAESYEHEGNAIQLLSQNKTLNAEIERLKQTVEELRSNLSTQIEHVYQVGRTYKRLLHGGTPIDPYEGVAEQP